MGQPSRTARPGTLTIPHAGEDMEPQERSLGAGGKAKWRRRSVSNLVTSYRTKHVLTTGSSICAPWCLPEGVESVCPHKHLHMDV